MKKVLKILFVLFITLSMIKPSFVSADDKLTVNVEVTLSGTKGTVEMKPWDKELKNDKYSPGPALVESILEFDDGDTKSFEVTFDTVGNYVYEIHQINKVYPSITYDYDIDKTGNSDKIYRFYITVVYNNENELEAFMEAEICDNYSCIINNDTDTEERLPISEVDDEEKQAINEQKNATEDLDNSKKPTDVCFVNEVFYWVHYEDGDHGTSDRLGNEENIPRNTGYYHTGKNSTTDDFNTVTPNSGYKFAGRYKYVITDIYGNIIEEGEISDDDLKTNGIKVIGNITLTPLYETIPTPPGPKWIQPITGIIAQNPVLYGGVFMGSLLLLFLFIKRNKDEKE